MLRLTRLKSLRLDMGRRGIEFLTKEFSFAQMTARYLKLYSYFSG